jgi:serine protease inhibitor
MALGMVLNGASEETQKSILSTIDYAGLTATEVNQAYKDLTALLLSMDRKVTLGIANGVWYDQQWKVRNSFTSIIENYYDGKVAALDFRSAGAKDVINGWVENKTNKRIKDLIANIETDEIMFLVNTLYFKGAWANQFDKLQTRKAPFTTIDGTKVNVDMMFSTGVVLKLYQNTDLQLLDIPYGNGQFRFTVVMPHKVENFKALTDGIDAAQLNAWTAQSDSGAVELEMPRFTMKWKEDLKSTLETMGMKTVDFPGLFEKTDSDLEISRVIHQTFIDVNEEGSEAAAATAIGIREVSAPAKPTRITINRPFLFMIREKHSGTILFIGRLMDPAVL